MKIIIIIILYLELIYYSKKKKKGCIAPRDCLEFKIFPAATGEHPAADLLEFLPVLELAGHEHIRLT